MTDIHSYSLNTFSCFNEPCFVLSDVLGRIFALTEVVERALVFFEIL